MISTLHIDSPLGTILASAEDRALTGLWFVGQKYFPAAAADWREDEGAAPFDALRRELDEYFAGRRTRFELPVNPYGGGGTAFQRAVWAAIAAVPLGITITYSSLAATCGRPAAARASGAATGRNPVSLIIPCHRIVGADGSLTGYAGGLERKTALLAFERAVAAGERGAIGRFVSADHAGRVAVASPPRQAELGLAR